MVDSKAISSPLESMGGVSGTQRSKDYDQVDFKSHGADDSAFSMPNSAAERAEAAIRAAGLEYDEEKKSE